MCMHIGEGQRQRESRKDRRAERGGEERKKIPEPRSTHQRKVTVNGIDGYIGSVYFFIKRFLCFNFYLIIAKTMKVLFLRMNIWEDWEG